MASGCLESGGDRSKEGGVWGTEGHEDLKQETKGMSQGIHGEHFCVTRLCGIAVCLRLFAAAAHIGVPYIKQHAHGHVVHVLEKKVWMDWEWGMP
jgi:hypothetical protein